MRCQASMPVGKSLRLFVSAVSVGLAGLWCTSVSADPTFTWNGSIDNYWDVPENWQEDKVPNPNVSFIAEFNVNGSAHDTAAAEQYLVTGIIFGGQKYNLSGNALTLGSVGIQQAAMTPVESIANPLIFSASQAWGLANPNYGEADLSGAISYVQSGTTPIVVTLGAGIVSDSSTKPWTVDGPAAAPAGLVFSGTTFSCSSLNVGSAATGAGNLSSGAVTLSTALNLGTSGGSNGAFLQTGGTLVSPLVSLGAGGTASYNLAGGTLLTASVTTTGGSGTFTFNGGTLQATASSTSFLEPSSVLIASNGATIDTNSFDINVSATVSSAPGTTGGLTKISAGILTLNGQNNYNGGTTVTGGRLAVATTASLGNSTQYVNIGGIPSAGLLLGAVNGSGGSVTSLQTNIGTLANGTATFNQASGIHTTSNVLIGDNTGVTAGYIMQAGTLTTTAIRFGNFSNSTETFDLDGGTVLTNIVEDNTASGAGVFNFDGGTIKSSVNSTNFVSSIGTVDVLANGGGIGTQTFNVTISQPLLHAASLGTTPDGGITKLGSGTLTYAAVNTYTGPTDVTLGTLEVANTGAIAGPISVSSGAVIYDAATTGGILHQTVGAVTLTGASTKFTLAQASASSSRMLLTTPSISVGPADRFDVKNNDLNITAQSLPSVNALVATGYQNDFNASGGITSSTAQADTTELHAIGVIQNNQNGAAIYDASHLFDGIAPGATDVLAKYTYYGDANLDGRVDGSDYTLIDNGFNNHLTGWYNGDFNYDGVLDGSDYTLIDNAFNIQGATIANQYAAVAAITSAVPEPSTFGLLGICVLNRLQRRHGRNGP